MANNEPKVRTRTKKRGDTTIVKTVTKQRLPGGGKVKSRYVEKYKPEGVTVKSSEKVKGAEDIAGRKQKMSMTSFKGPSYEIEKKMLKEKGPKGSKTKTYSVIESEMMPKQKYVVGRNKVVNIPETTEKTSMRVKKEKAGGMKKVERTKSTSGMYDFYGKKIAPKTTTKTKTKKR